MRQKLLQNVTAILLQNSSGLLFQNATAITKCDDFITKRDNYYKMRRLLQIATVQTSFSVSKVTTYRLEACNLARKGTAKTSRKKISNTLRRAILQNARRKTSLEKSSFNKIPEIDPRPATLLERSFYQRGFPIATSEISVLRKV